MKFWRCLLLAAIILRFVPSAQAQTNSAQLYLDSLVDFERYGETIWHTATGTNVPPDSGYFGDGASGGNGGIRGSSEVAMTYAVLVKAFPNDTKNTTRLAHIRQALNYAANTHVSGANTCIDGLKWGHDWQTALWGGSMGFAALLVQSNLPAATIQSVQRAVADEATYRAGIAPASGYIGDTKAEENGWDANIVALTAAWMSTNTNSATWLLSAKKYLANTYTVANTNGDPLASWVTTTTLYPSFALENHGFYHPTYQMVAGLEMGDSLLMAQWGNTNVASQLQPFAEHNVLNVWGHLNHIVLDSGEFAYPSGLDWALHDYEQNSYIAWLATHFNDPLARQADQQLAQMVRYRQLINGDGRYVGESEPNGFYREAVEASRAAIAWLHHTGGLYTNGPVTNVGPDIKYSPDIKLLTHRSAAGFASISYGDRIMAMIEPAMVSMPSNTFVTTPRLPGIIGLGVMGAATAAQLVNLTTNNDSDFTAELLLQHGAYGTSRVYVKSTGETVAVVEVPWTVNGVASASAGSFAVGIENDPLIGGSRLIEWNGSSAIFTNRSGVSRNITNQWVCVAGRYGVTAGPGGYFNYQTASSYNRLGAAEDTLQFMPTNGLTARYGVWFLGKNATQTAAGAAQIDWQISGTNGTLTFPGAGGVNVQLPFILPPSTGNYLPYVLPIASVSGSSSQGAYPPINAVDGNTATFWVSSGTTAGQGPTAAKPETLSFTFPRLVAVSQLQVAPRTLNGGYGPKAISMLLNGVSVYSGTMGATTNFAMTLPKPVYATNAQLVITSSYDPGSPSSPRNVQVIEVTFYERAIPGSFGDWLLGQLSASQMTSNTVSSVDSDPDGDGVPNILEFATGGNLLVNDGDTLKSSFVRKTPGLFSIRFLERTNLGDLTRQIQSSTNLIDWNSATPVQERVVTNVGVAQLHEADFTAQTNLFFYRVSYHQ